MSKVYLSVRGRVIAVQSSSGTQLKMNLRSLEARSDEALDKLAAETAAEDARIRAERTAR